MKTISSMMLSMLYMLFAFVPSTLAQDHTQWHLPEGAKVRLGKGSINGIAYSPDWTRLAVASSIGIWFYDVQTGEELDLLGYTDEVYSIVAFSPDGRTLASGGHNGTIRLWNIDTGKHIRILIGHEVYDHIYSLVFSPDGRTLASGGSGHTIRLWDVNTGAQIRTLTEHTDDVYSVAFSPDGNTLASGGRDHTIRLWKTNTGAQLRTLDTGPVYSVAFSPDGNTLASGGRDHTIRLWDVNTGAQIRTLTEHTDDVYSVAFSPDGNTLASGGRDHTIRLWDVNTGAQIRTLRGDLSSVYSVAFSPDGNTLASEGADTIHLWDVNTGAQIRTLTEHSDVVNSIAFSPDGRILASGGWRWGTKTIHLWDVDAGAQIRTLTGHRHNVNSVAFSPDGNTLASGGDDYTIRLWDVNTGAQIRTLKGHTDGVYSVAFSPDGNTLASGGDDYTIRLWDVNTGAQIRTLTGHRHNVNSVAFSPDGLILASGGRDRTTRLWDIDIGTQIRALDTGPVDSIAFSPDGRILASGGARDEWSGIISIWDVNIGERVRILAVSKDYGHIESVAFSPDGRILVSGGWRWGNRATIHLWDVNTGTQIRTLTGNTDGVNSVAFSPDGLILASGGWDGTVLLWELASSLTTSTTVRISFLAAQVIAIGEHLTFPITITDGVNVAGYQAIVSYDASALRYVSSKNGDYFGAGAFFIPPVAGRNPGVEGNSVQLAASSLAGETDGDGTLATITFEVVAVKNSTVRLSDVLLTDSEGGISVPQTESAEITIPPQLPEDVNGDGVVNIVDLTLVASNFGNVGENDADVNGDGVVNIVDLTLVAAAFGNNAEAAPALWSTDLDDMPSRATVAAWLHAARQVTTTHADYQRGIVSLENLLKALTPKETALLANYPNPFNPETWIPYQLATPADVTVTIYAVDGKLIRTLALGHQPIGIYQRKSRAAYWDGKNALGESVASGVYFYTLKAGDFTATRKMLIQK